jgi:hypothetical protein
MDNHPSFHKAINEIEEGLYNQLDNHMLRLNGTKVLEYLFRDRVDPFVLNSSIESSYALVPH